MIGSGRHSTSTPSSNSTVIVVDPRMNQADIDFTRLPVDADVFRSGNFVAEPAAYFGRRVAGWFPGDSVTPAEIAKLALRGEYDVDGVYIDGTRSLMSPTELERAGVTDLIDYSSLVAEHPALAKYFMSEARPPVVSTMAAVAAAKGYRRVLILSRELASVPTGRRFVRERPRTPEQTDHRLSLSRRYEAWHPTNSGLALLREAQEVFTDVDFLDATLSNRMRLMLEPAPVCDASERLAPEPKYPSAHSSFYTELPVGANGVTARCAYVTMCDSEEYLWGVRALANSLAKVSSIPLILMVPPGFSVGATRFEHGNVRLYEVNSLRSPHTPRDHQLRFANTYTKLEVFGLSFLDRAAFLDADTVVLKSPDGIFEYPGFAAAPDFGLRLENFTFNSGVFVCDPSPQTYAAILDAVPATPSYDSGDQGFLNSFMTEITWLPPEYNSLRRALSRFPDVVELERAKIVHFVGPKPWEIMQEANWTSHDDLWFAQLTEREKIAFLVHLRKQAGELALREPDVQPAAKKPKFKQAADLVASGQAAEAIRMTRRALRDNPQSLANRKVLSRALWAEGKRVDAVKVRAKTVALRAVRTAKERVQR